MRKNSHGSLNGGKVRRGSVQSILTSKKGVTSCNNTPHELEHHLSTEQPNGGWDALEKFLKAVEAVSLEIDPDKVACAIIKEACGLIDADRSTLFFVDAEANELILVFAKGAKNISIPIGVGIAGTVAATGEFLNIPDAYKDERFSPAYDKKTGYRTKAVLAIPVRDNTGDIVAVLQCINKVNSKEDFFSEEDLFKVECFSQHIGMTLGNSRVYENERQAKEKVASMLDIVELIHSPSTNENSLIFALSHKAHALVDGDRCTLYLVDKEREQLVVQQGDIDFRFPVSKGIAGYVASTGKALVIDDAYDDPRFSPVMDKQTGYRTKAVLCVAIEGKRVDGQKPVIGVLQVINKVDDNELFTKTDLDLLSTLLGIAGPLLESSHHYQSLGEHHSSKMVKGEAVLSPKARKAYLPAAKSFNEDEEEEETTA